MYELAVLGLAPPPVGRGYAGTICVAVGRDTQKLGSVVGSDMEELPAKGWPNYAGTTGCRTGHAPVGRDTEELPVKGLKTTQELPVPGTMYLIVGRDNVGTTYLLAKLRRNHARTTYTAVGGDMYNKNSPSAWLSVPFQCLKYPHPNNNSKANEIG